MRKQIRSRRARNSLGFFERLESRFAMTVMSGEYVSLDALPSTAHEDNAYVSTPESLSYAAKIKPVLAADVTADSYVSPEDALAIINYLNEYGPGPAPASVTAGPLYLDTTQDNLITADDVILVVNFINAFSWREGSDPGEFSIVCVFGNPEDYPLTNLIHGNDVTGDGNINAEDALAVINYLQEHGPGPVPTSATSGPLYLDTTADNQVTAEDVFVVVNYLIEIPREGIVRHRLFYRPPIDVVGLQPHLVEEGSELPGIYVDLAKIAFMSTADIFQEYPTLVASIFPEGAVVDTLRELVTDRRPLAEFVDPLIALGEFDATLDRDPPPGGWGFRY